MLSGRAFGGCFFAEGPSFPSLILASSSADQLSLAWFPSQHTIADNGIQEIPVLRTPERIIVRPRVKLTGIGDHMATLSRMRAFYRKSGGLPALYGAHETNCNASKGHDAQCLKNVQMPVSNSRLFVCDSQEEPVVENAAHRGDTVALTSDAFTAHIGLQLLFDGEIGRAHV